MNDPGSGVPPTLLPHVHLISNFKFPLQAQLGLEQIVDYLLQAPNITRHSAPMTWAFLDAPANGSVLLVWQPGQLGNQMASDGYVWGDPESAFTMIAKDCNVEMFTHRVGYQYPNESVASHCRRRYRLVGSKNPNVTIDPSLWLIHYLQSEPQQHLPVNRIPISAQMQQMMHTRRYLQSAGQLVRKEFMLHDRANWPTVNVPAGQMGAPFGGHQGSMYPGGPPPPGARAQGSQYFPQQAQQQPPQHMSHGPGPSPKRQRQTPPGPMAGAGSAIAASAIPGHEMSIEEEEDTSRGDSLDHLTPREISMMRYRQHHEWMEEILSSPYAIGQIVPVDLGLGLKGELEPFTEGFFQAPTGGAADGKPATVGKMEPGKADEFRKRAAQKLAEMNAEIDKMKRKQAKRMGKLKKGGVMRDGERRLRSAVSDPASTGNEAWRLEGLDEVEDDPEGPEVGAAAQKPKESVDGVVQEVEQALNKQVGVTPSLVCVQRGGLEDKAASDDNVRAETNDAHGTPGSAMDQPIITDTSTAMLDDFGLSSRSHSQQNHDTNQGTPNVPQMPSSHATPAESTHTPSYQSFGTTANAPANGTPPGPLQAPSQEPVPSTAPPSMPDSSNMDVDTEMTGATDGPVNAPEDASDWVMVNKDGTTPQASNNTPQSQQNPLQSEVPSAPQPSADTPGLGAFTNTPSSGIQGFTPSANTADNPPDAPVPAPASLPGQDNTGTPDVLDASAFGDFGVNLDTAGDALAGYGQEEGGEDLPDLGLDDSAFGDAFHGTDMDPDREAQ
ncbi:MAG: hypothetical protein M4579_000913 [Chaenotheca gracillima]|nr:MAG: hypothetical protein M4579_000913 [Chaenotheca gracillima]